MAFEACIGTDALPKVRTGNSFDAAARLLTVTHHVVVGERDPIVRGLSTVQWRPARETGERIGMKDLNGWLRRFLAMCKAAPMVRRCPFPAASRLRPRRPVGAPAL